MYRDNELIPSINWLDYVTDDLAKTFKENVIDIIFGLYGNILTNEIVMTKDLNGIYKRRLLFKAKYNNSICEQIEVYEALDIVIKYQGARDNIKVVTDLYKNELYDFYEKIKGELK